MDSPWWNQSPCCSWRRPRLIEADYVFSDVFLTITRFLYELEHFSTLYLLIFYDAHAHVFVHFLH